MGKLRNIYRDIRAARRIATFALAVPGILGLAAVQAFIVGPLSKGKSTAIPNLIYKTGRKLLGIKIVFNENSVPLVKDRPVWFVTNHTYGGDYFQVGGILNGSFVGKSDMLKVPFLGPIIKSMKFIPIHRSRDHNAQSRGLITESFNAGRNVIMFPEGTVGDGIRINRFRAAIMTLLFGEKGVDANNNEVTLNQDVVVQPVASKLVKVDGKDPTANDNELIHAYRMDDKMTIPKALWLRMKFKSVTFELTAFDPLEPGKFKRDGATAKENAQDLINFAAKKVVDVVNPGQEGFEKADIPNDDKPAANSLLHKIRARIKLHPVR